MKIAILRRLFFPFLFFPLLSPSVKYSAASLPTGSGRKCGGPHSPIEGYTCDPAAGVTAGRRWEMGKALARNILDSQLRRLRFFPARDI
ncbi:hypothetical protein F4804DRAFT_307073 [Jackrogersella minutella]|nr:hypothetical protein F4804DRAFT_307073 [Jackrogersella minutella]